MSEIFRSKQMLRGRTIMLSASVPSVERSDTYRRIPDCQLHIEEGVVSLSRAVFANGGRLVFGGHPTILPLVSMVAAEYVAARRLESNETPPSPAIVYQSAAFEVAITEMEHRMVSMGYAEERLVPSVNGEKFDESLIGVPQCEESLRAMRERMVLDTDPLALICMGGMEGVEREFQLFVEARPGRPIWLWEATGGATAILADRLRLFRGESRIHIVDMETIRSLQQRVQGEAPRKEPTQSEEPASPEVVPYPYLMQQMIGELVRGQ